MQTDHRSSLFLLELIVAILFFALASAVCMQLFARSHTLQQETKDLNQGLLLAQSAAAVFESRDGDLAALEEFFPQGTLDASGAVFTALYGSDWEPLPETAEAAEAAYQLTAVLASAENGAGEDVGDVEDTGDGGCLRQAQITLTRLSGPEEGAEIICSLPAAAQLPRTVPADSGQQEERS